MVKSLQKILANLPLDPEGDSSFKAALTNIALVALSMRGEDAVNGITFNVKRSAYGDKAVNITWSYDENVVDEEEDDSAAWLTLQGGLFHQSKCLDLYFVQFKF